MDGKKDRAETSFNCRVVRVGGAGVAGEIRKTVGTHAPRENSDE